jgi:hypothetical protein
MGLMLGNPAKEPIGYQHGVTELLMRLLFRAGTGLTPRLGLICAGCQGTAAENAAHAPSHGPRIHSRPPGAANPGVLKCFRLRWGGAEFGRARY